MAKNKFKEKNIAMPVENHETAAWANVADTKSISNVTIADEYNVKNAKEWVDSNEK